jgi:hypothetical protein
MRTILGLALAATIVSGVSAADLDYGYDEPAVLYRDEVYVSPRRVVRVKRTPCITCRGSRLPWGGLRRTYEADLPWGGLPAYCPPESVAVRPVLVRKY